MVRSVNFSTTLREKKTSQKRINVAKRPAYRGDLTSNLSDLLT